MTRDEINVLAGENVGEVIERAIKAGMTFDEAIEELRFQIMNAIENRENYGQSR